MTSTRPLIALAALLAGLALGLGAAGPGAGQPPRGVDLESREGKDHFWKITRDGDRFVAVRIGKGDKAPIYKNFRPGLDGMKVGDMHMAYDPDGRTKELRARPRYGEDTEWDKVGGRFGMRLRVPKGPLKGWWVGLGPLEPAREGQLPRARLMLVEDRKDAAVFTWPDPVDDWAP
jgi:hypothetical protein